MTRTRSKLLVASRALVGVALVATACGPPPGVRPPSGGPTAVPTTLFTAPPHLYRETPLNGWSHNGTAYSVDIAGNNVGKQFEVDLVERIEKRFKDEVVSLAFRVR